MLSVPLDSHGASGGRHRTNVVGHHRPSATAAGTYDRETRTQRSAALETSRFMHRGTCALCREAERMPGCRSRKPRFTREPARPGLESPLPPAGLSFPGFCSPTDGRQHSEAAVSPLTAAAAFSREKSPEGSQDGEGFEVSFLLRVRCVPVPHRPGPDKCQLLLPGSVFWKGGRTGPSARRLAFWLLMGCEPLQS